MRTDKKIFIGILLFICGSTSVFTQNGSNPFELTPRLPAAAKADSGTTVKKDTSNPFDLIAPSSASAKKKATARRRVRNPLSEEATYRRFLFVMIVGIMLLLTLMMTLFRSFFQKAYSAFSNDNMMNLVYRERESIGPTPFLILYSLFFINAGLFAYFVLRHYQINLSGGPFLQWFYCAAALLGLFLLKHFLLNVVGFIFPVEKETRLYNFLIMVFGIVIGIFLTPINILLAYGPANFSSILIFGTLGAGGLVYLFRYLRSIFIANRFILFHRFHFLLYICSVEIAPVMVLVKLVLNQI